MDEADEIVAIPVFAWKLPIPLGDGRFHKASDAITLLYGECYIRQVRNRLIFYTDGRVCSCQWCADYLETFVHTLDRLANQDYDFLEFAPGMIICEECGNKRCPHATDHREECTGSNVPGQAGSIYA